MAVWQAQQQTVDTPTARPLRQWLRFLGHFGEMNVVMMLGMCLLAIPYSAVMGAIGYARPWQQLPELSALVMTVNMTVPMVAWMVFRGHHWERAVEMGIAMILPAVVIIPLWALGFISGRSLSGALMTPMLPIMLALMLYRRDHYLHTDSRQQDVAAAGQ